MADIFRTSDDQSAVPAEDAVAEDTTAEETAAEPIVIRKLDRLETTSRASNPSGN
jgi:hypothetical protein